MVVKSELLLTEKPIKVEREGSVNVCKDVLVISIELDTNAESVRVVNGEPEIYILFATDNAGKVIDVNKIWLPWMKISLRQDVNTGKLIEFKDTLLLIFTLFATVNKGRFMYVKIWLE